MVTKPTHRKIRDVWGTPLSRPPAVVVEGEIVGGEVVQTAQPVQRVVIVMGDPVLGLGHGRAVGGGVVPSRDENSPSGIALWHSN
jgi:hypothetical protein